MSSEAGGTAIASGALAEALARVRRAVPGARPDGWTPSVQGAVGHVVGVRDAGSGRYVLKVYPAGAEAGLETEVLALRLAADAPGLAVPRVVLSGGLADSGAVGFVLMTRLSGTRWADRRRALSPARTTALAREAGAALRVLHEVHGPRFGALVDGGPAGATAWEWTAARTARLLGEHVRTGGPRDVADRVRRLVEDRRPAVETCAAPALCHHDWIDGNLLLTDGPEPRLSGVVDFEAAAWDDPLSDLAQTRVHVRFHAPADDDALLAGYGLATADERARLEVYDVLHLVRERAWVAVDRPPGWQAALAALDERLART